MTLWDVILFYKGKDQISHNDYTCNDPRNDNQYKRTEWHIVTLRFTIICAKSWYGTTKKEVHKGKEDNQNG